MELVNTTALVTGSASGLGAATASTLAKRGARVVGIDLPDAVACAPDIAGVTYMSPPT